MFEHGLFFMNVTPESEISQWIQGIQTHFDMPAYLEGLINKQCSYIYIYICTRPCHPPPPPPIWDGSHILVPYEIFPLPPLWCGGGVALSPSPPCGVVGVWYGMVGMYGVYGRSGMACLESMVCLVCMVGMVCMA